MRTVITVVVTFVVVFSVMLFAGSSLPERITNINYSGLWKDFLWTFNSPASLHNSYETWETPGDELLPRVNLELEGSWETEWRAHVKFSNFSFAPETATTIKPGEGYVHLYLNGEEIARLASTTEYTIGHLPLGNHSVTARLVTFDHMEIVSGKQFIEDEEFALVREEVTDFGTYWYPDEEQ